MKIVKLTEEQFNLVEGMDPLFMLSRAKLGNGFVLGAFVQDEEGYDIPAGVMVCTQTADSIVIDWLWILVEFQEQGLGTEFLDRIVELSKEQGIRTVSVYYADSYLYRSICPDGARFFREYGFRSETELCGEFLTDIRSALKKQKEVLRSDLDGLVLLENCKEDILRRLVGEAIGQTDADLFFAYDGDGLSFDPGISFVMANKHSVSGALLNTRVGDIIYPVCFLARDEEAEKKLVHASLLAAKKKYGEDCRICVIKQREQHLEIVKATMPGDYVRNFLLSETVEHLQDKSFRRGTLALVEPNDDFESDEESDILQFLRSGYEKESSFEILAKKAEITGKEDFGGIEVIGHLTVKELQDILLECNYHNTLGAFERLPLHPDLKWFDSDLSCCVKVEGRIRSLLLVHSRSDGAIAPVLLYVDKPEDTAYLFHLLKYMCVKGIDKYSVDTRITVCCHNEKMTALYERLFRA